MKFTPPDNPGCYLYKDIEGTIIYVGKAKNLKKRVSSYFVKKHDDTKTRHLVSHISDAEFIVTDNEVEALLLENNLIKKYKPKYNLMLKDSLRFAYIGITNEKYPRILTVRDKDAKGIKLFFGPYTNGYGRKQIVELLNATFHIRTCITLPKKVCLKYHLKLCKGPCENLQTKEEYILNIKRATEILKGNTDKIVEELKEEMKQHAKEKNYEKAKELRDKIIALEHLSDSQKVEKHKKFNQDIIHYNISNGKANFLVFNIDKGTIINKQDFSFDIFEDELESNKKEESEILDQFVKQFYSVNEIPKEIIIPHHLQDEDKIKEYLESLSGFKIEFSVPKIG
ncbi:MAG: excinuclease ABC subunit UvrC, partial [Candidatus Woesearchaeota archaeon]